MSMESDKPFVSPRQQENKMQGAKRGVVVNVKPAKAATPERYDDWQKAKSVPYEESSAPYKKGGPVVKSAKSMSVKTEMSPAMSARETRTMQKYKAAMASRPNRGPLVKPQVVDALAPIVRRMARPAAPMPMTAGPPEVPSPMAVPAMKKGGKVMKKADGGMASSIRPAKDYNASDKDFVAARAQQLSSMVGKPMKKGGLDSDVKQDKAMIKAAVHKHEKGMHPGKPLTKLRKGGMAC